MAYPNQINTDILTAKTYYSNMNEDYLASINRGGCDCSLGDKMRELYNIIRSLEYERDTTGDLNNVINVYNKMMEIIGGVAYIPPVIVNAIYTGTGTPTTEGQITAGLLTLYTEDTPMVVNFANPSYLINYLAIPISAPIPTEYLNLNSPFDTGDIGTPDDLFGAFTEIGGFRVAVTNYVVPLTDPYLFS